MSLPHPSTVSSTSQMLRELRLFFFYHEPFSFCCCCLGRSLAKEKENKGVVKFERHSIGNDMGT